MSNRDLLKEAIADAKAVKEMAITNAKIALEEAFTPQLKSMLEKKLQEMEDKDENKYMHTEEKHGDESMSEEELNELLAELEAEDSEEPMKEAEEEEAEEEEKEEEEDFDLESMSEDDLKAFIEEVVDEMIATGELEAGEEQEEVGEEAPEEQEIADEELEEVEEPMMEAPKKEEEDAEKKHMQAELAEALQAITQLRGELHEINLLNSKLLYSNKIFKAKNLTETQKVKVLTTFDKAETVKEVKLVYETLLQGLTPLTRPVKREAIKESKSFASKPIGVSPKQPVVETDSMVSRFQRLAGIK